MYSLLSAAVLAVDLVKHPEAIALADTLDVALTLGPADLAVLQAAAANRPVRAAAAREVEAACRGPERLTTTLPAARELSAQGRLVPQDLVGGSALGATPLGGLADLLRLVRREVLDWTADGAGGLTVQHYADGVTAVVDAVAAAYARAVISPQAYAELRAPWEQVVGPLPSVAPGNDRVPRAAGLRRLLDLLATAEIGDLRRLERAHWQAGVSRTSWSTSMHTACRVAEDLHRLRVVAAAQLAAVRAARLTSMPPAGLARAVMMAVTAAVQVLCVADQLPSDTAAVLLDPWESVFGRLP